MWKFRELQQGEPERDPHEAEFFRLAHASEAIVREFIQNSLDAKVPGGNVVKVRFVLGTVRRSELDRFVEEEFTRHLKASELFPQDYPTTSFVPFLTMEDYGTTGLDGETGENVRPKGRHNFYNFWWCEGKSQKKGQEGGRWGLGKTTFHIISKLRVFWGYTVRHDDGRKLLMGKALLKAHRLDKKTYQYYGYYVKDGFAPIDSNDTIGLFRRAFSIRRTDESGLSLVIPMPQIEITVDAVIRSVIIHYFYAIMNGDLEVEIAGDSGTVKLDSVNLAEMASDQNWRGTAWEDMNRSSFLKFIKNCIENEENGQFVLLPDECAESLQIDESSFGNRLDHLREDFAESDFLSVRVPLFVQMVGKPKSKSYFDIHMHKTPTLKEPQEYYIRSGITITEMRTLGTHQVRTLLVAKDDPISEFLGDAETPAHTKWNRETEGFKSKYENAAKTLAFITRSLVSIVSLLDEPPKERQKDFLKDIFFVSQPEREDEEIGREKSVPLITAKRKRFGIVRTGNGIRITLLEDDPRLPIRGHLKLAYDVRRGNPFKNFEVHDFDLGSGSVATNSRSCSITVCGPNAIEMSINNRDFFLELGGFDKNRDLVVDIQEIRNETQA